MRDEYLITCVGCVVVVVEVYTTEVGGRVVVFICLCGINFVILTLHKHNYMETKNKKIYDDYQEEVINIEEGYHLVLAPPGCGKTDILAERIVRALKRGVDIDDILCLTFTNRAARGMRDRINQFVGEEKGEKLFVGNIHHFCSTFLYGNGVISQNTAIIDETDMADIIGSFAKKYKKGIPVNSQYVSIAQHLARQIKSGYDKEMLLNLDHMREIGISTFCKLLGLDLNLQSPGYIYDKIDEIVPDNTLEQILIEYDLMLNHKSSDLDVCIDNYIRAIAKAFEGTGIVKIKDYDEFRGNIYLLICCAVIFKCARRYEEYKNKYSLLDFDDLLLDTYEYLRDTEEPIKKYTCIQVDEVQDLNPMQHAIVDIITDKDRNPAVLYLGDEQQAIFSFMGAKLETLEQLKDSCEGNIHHLHTNYRSPKYLLDVFNTYAEKQLKISKELLPVHFSDDAKDNESLTIYSSEYYDKRLKNPKQEDNYNFRSIWSKEVANDMGEYILSLSKYWDFQKLGENERTAILVRTNKEADVFSDFLYKQNVKHFKVSGTDLFSILTIQMIVAHLNALYNDFNFIAWSRLLYGLKVFDTFEVARDFVGELRNKMIAPSDFLMYNGSTYVREFHNCYKGDFVIFDTESTGVDVFNDDIVQIAAIKMKDGEIIAEFDIMIDTEKQIPEYLGDIKNPLPDEFRERKQKGEVYSRKEGLLKFLEFAKDTIILGHNVEYDYHILDYNLRRDCGLSDISERFPVYFDTLKLAKLVEPRLKKYKLKLLLEQLHLEGANSHLANDDIIATKSVADYCYDKISGILEQQMNFIESKKDIVKSFVKKYQSTYTDSKLMLYEPLNNEVALCHVMQRAYNDFVSNGVEKCDKLNYILNYIGIDVVNLSVEPTLIQQLNNHIMEINTYKESDLCDSKSMTDKLFLMTVHKAKGLEFENVIVFHVNDDTYPFYYDKIGEPKEVQKKMAESARLLYVAMSRAKKRLCLTHSKKKVVYSKKYDKYYVFYNKISPFLEYIAHYFDAKYLFPNNRPEDVFYE